MPLLNVYLFRKILNRATKVFVLSLCILLFAYVVLAWHFLNLWHKCAIDSPRTLPLSWRLANDVAGCSHVYSNSDVDTRAMSEAWGKYYGQLLVKYKPEVYPDKNHSECSPGLQDDITKNIQHVLNYKIMKNSPCIISNATYERMPPFIKVENKIVSDGRDGQSDMILHIEAPPVIVTATSSDHFFETQALLKSIQIRLVYFYPEIRVIVYDLGLSSKELELMKKYCKCEVRTFQWSNFPEHVRIVKAIAWKPLVLLETLFQFKFIMWVDASIRFRGTKRNWNELFQKAHEIGILLQQNPLWKVNMQTKPDTFQILEERECLFDYPELESGWILFKRNWFTMNVIMKAWSGCALTRHCLAHPFPTYLKSCSNDLWKFLMNTRCHRFDQSVLNIILIRIFNKHRRLIEFDRTDLGDIKREDREHFFPAE